MHTVAVMEKTMLKPTIPAATPSPQKVLSSTAPDTMPSSIPAGTTYSPIAVTVIPYVELDGDGEREQDSGRKQSGVHKVSSRATYPKMCYFSPIQFLQPQVKEVMLAAFARGCH